MFVLTIEYAFEEKDDRASRAKHEKAIASAATPSEVLPPLQTVPHNSCCRRLSPPQVMPFLLRSRRACPPPLYGQYGYLLVLGIA